MSDGCMCANHRLTNFNSVYFRSQFVKSVSASLSPAVTTIGTVVDDRRQCRVDEMSWCEFLIEDRLYQDEAVAALKELVMMFFFLCLRREVDLHAMLANFQLQKWKRKRPKKTTENNAQFEIRLLSISILMLSIYLFAGIAGNLFFFSFVFRSVHLRALSPFFVFFLFTSTSNFICFGTS